MASCAHLPSVHAGILSSGSCTGYFHALMVTMSSYVHLPCRVWETLFPRGFARRLVCSLCSLSSAAEEIVMKRLCMETGETLHLLCAYREQSFTKTRHWVKIEISSFEVGPSWAWYSWAIAQSLTAKSGIILTTTSKNLEGRTICSLISVYQYRRFSDLNYAITYNCTKC